MGRGEEGKDGRSEERDEERKAREVPSDGEMREKQEEEEGDDVIF